MTDGLDLPQRMSVREAREAILVPTNPAPTVCRMVHFVDVNLISGAVTCRAATVTHVWAPGDVDRDYPEAASALRELYEVDEIEPAFGIPGSEWVALHVLTVTGCTAIPFACHDEKTKLAKTWHWPERQA